MEGAEEGSHGAAEDVGEGEGEEGEEWEWVDQVGGREGGREEGLTSRQGKFLDSTSSMLL